jgi:hypothetical protein
MMVKQGTLLQIKDTWPIRGGGGVERVLFILKVSPKKDI